jgi:predicted AAA+ superfamily ATPase
VKELKKPDICGALEHTVVFNSNESRLTQIAVDATMLMKQRRATLNELVAPQIQSTIEKKVDERLQLAMKNQRDEHGDRDRRDRRDSVDSGRGRSFVRPTLHRMKFDEVVKNVVQIPQDILMSSKPKESVIVIPDTIPIMEQNEVIMESTDHPVMASLD